ncbi:MAG: hypothetical protein WBZ29_00390 [Methanocella sp.]
MKMDWKCAAIIVVVLMLGAPPRNIHPALAPAASMTVLHLY